MAFAWKPSVETQRSWKWSYKLWTLWSFQNLVDMFSSTVQKVLLLLLKKKNVCTVQHSLQKVIVALLLFCHKPFCDVWNSRSSSRRQNQTFYIFYNLIKFGIGYKVHQKQIKAEGKIKTNLHFMFSYFVYICRLFLANRAMFLLPFFRK